MTNNRPKYLRGGRGSFQLIFPDHSPLFRELRAESQADAMEAHSLAYAELVFLCRLGPSPKGWMVLLTKGWVLPPLLSIVTMPP